MVFSSSLSHSAFLFKFVSVAQIPFQKSSTSYLAGRLVKVMLLPLKSCLTDFGMVLNLLLMTCLSYFFLCHLSFVEVALSSCFRNVRLKLRVVSLVLPYFFFIKFFIYFFLMVSKVAGRFTVD